MNVLKMGGAFVSPIDERDYTMADLNGSAEVSIPNEFHYKSEKDIKILDQEDTMACTGFAASYALRSAFFIKNYLSQWFIYHNRDLSNGWDIPFEGNYIKNVLKHLTAEGCALIDDYNNPKECPDGIYDLDKLKPQIFEKSKIYKIALYIKLNTLEDVQKFMNLYPENSAVLASMAVYPSVLKVKNDGIIPECEGKLSGHHCVFICGYKDKFLRFANSIGDKWGDNGFGYLNTEDPLLISELWGILINREVKKPEYKKYYIVQIGAFKDINNAKMAAKDLSLKGIDCFIKYINGLYKLQCGAFINKENAIKLKQKLMDLGYITFIAEN